MNHFFLLALLISAVSCVKHEKKEINIKTPSQKNTHSFTYKKKGLRCDLVGEAESKVIFIQIKKQESSTVLYFRDFTESGKVTTIFGTYDGYKLLSFNLNKNEGSDLLVGEAMMVHNDNSTLTDEGKVIYISGRMTWNEDLTGIIERKITISRTEGGFKTGDFEELAKIENCEEYEATWL